MKLLNHTLSYLAIAFFLVIGIWAAFFYMNMLDEIYDSIDDGLENSKILIIQKAEQDSTIINRTNFMESNYAIHEISAAQATAFRDVYIDSTMYMVNEKDFEPVRMLKSAFRLSSGKYYQLQVISSMVEEDDLMEDLLYAIWWLYILLLVSILVINNVLLKKIWKPFYHILERLRGFDVERQESTKDIETKVAEFNVLNESVTALLERTTTSFHSQKQFIENASHELQTPLAIGINKLELLAEKTTSDLELREISDVIQTLQRLTRLNKTLLLLSRIENKQFTDTKIVDLNKLADQVISDLSDLAQYKSVQVLCIHESTFTQTMNPELASIMLSNLIKNSIVHNFEGGSVEVRIIDAAIVIENTSKVSALEESKIFKRFYKNTSANTSTGLGLAIVKSIADLYGFKISYHSQTQKHSFKIAFHRSV
ncbi:MAG TPA: HAMP domain-containing sensor histidine kinase [Ohtaekwangia sp.]|nr:HAMP domain-containing sensor histidine kinase [Ohtaekwangia sp.]